MSLSIAVRRIDKDFGTFAEEIPLPPGGDLAGFEVWRRTVYGSEEAVRLGLVILPSLREAGELWIRGGDLDVLKKEAELIAEHAALFAQRAASDEDTVRIRARNISRACELALSSAAGVWIS